MHNKANEKPETNESLSPETEYILTASGEIAAGLESVISLQSINKVIINKLQSELDTLDEAETAESEIDHTIKESKNSTAVINKTTSTSKGLKQYLENLGYEVVAKREKGGALWLIGDTELINFIEELRKQKISFTFAYNGSKSTNRRPAWFTSYQG